MNIYDEDPVFITDSTMCSNLDPKVPCPIRDSNGNADYNYYMLNQGVENDTWKRVVEINSVRDPECEVNWPIMSYDGTLNTLNVPYKMGSNNGDWCKKKNKFSKHQMMKIWNEFGCTSDWPVTVNTQAFQGLQTINDLRYNLQNYKNSKRSNNVGYCHDFQILKGGEKLNSGEKLYSENRQFFLEMSINGRLVIYGNSNNIVWSSFAAADSTMTNGYLALQVDGNLVLYRTNNTAYWVPSPGLQLGPNKGIDYIMMLNNNGVLCIYNTSTSPYTLVWKSSTTVVSFPETSGQRYFNIRNRSIKNIKESTYPKMSNNTFDITNPLNTEDALFLTLMSKNIINCSKDPTDPYCIKYYNDGNSRITESIRKSSNNIPN